MKTAFLIFIIMVLFGAGLSAYLYTPTPTAAPLPPYSDNKKSAMAARAEKQAQADIIEERMNESILATKASAKKADMDDAINRRNEAR